MQRKKVGKPMSFNNVFIDGHLADQPEFRVNAAGNQVLCFTVCINDEVINRPTYVACAMFGDKAATIAPKMQKGHRVIVSGRLHNSRINEKYTRVDIIAHDVVRMTIVKADNDEEAEE